MRTFIGRLVLPLIFVLLGCGIYLFGGLGTGGPVMCGGSSLREGEPCSHLSKDGTRITTYEQQKASNNRMNVLVQESGQVVVGMGVVSALWVLASSGVRSLRSLRRRDEDEPAQLELVAGPGPA